jgi:arginase family enzyme
VIDPVERRGMLGDTPDYAGLLTFGSRPYTPDPAEPAGFDVAVVGAPMDVLVSDRAGARFRAARDPRRERAAGTARGDGRRRARRAARGRLRRRACAPG